MTCFMFFYRTALATAYGRCFPGQNIWLRPNVKIVPTVQHWFLILTNLEFLMGGVKNLGTLDLTLIKGFSKKTSVLKFFVILFKENCPRQWSMVYLMKKRKALGYTVLGPDFLFVKKIVTTYTGNMKHISLITILVIVTLGQSTAKLC